MLNRMKTALVRSYVGAIATGWLLAECIYTVATALTLPLRMWLQLRIQQQQSFSVMGQPESLPAPRFQYEMAIPQLLSAVLLLLAAWGLLRWLYWSEETEQNAEEETPTEETQE